MISSIGSYNIQSNSSGDSTPSVVDQFEKFLEQYHADFALWEQAQFTGMDMTQFDAKLETDMNKLVSFADLNYGSLSLELQKEGWVRGKSYGPNMNPFDLLDALQNLPQIFSEGRRECTLEFFNECADTLLFDLQNPPPKGSSLIEVGSDA